MLLRYPSVVCYSRSLSLIFACFLVLNGCSSSSQFQPSALHERDAVPGSSVTWSQLISPRLSQTDQDLIHRVVLNNSSNERAVLRSDTALFVIIDIDAQQPRVYVNRPELSGALSTFREDSSDPHRALNLKGQAIPIPYAPLVTANSGPEVHPLSQTAVEPYREIRSVAGYSAVTTTITPPCQNRMYAGDAVFMYMGGYSSNGNTASAIEAGVGNEVYGNTAAAHQQDFVPYIRGMGAFWWTTSIGPPPSGVSIVGQYPPFYYQCGKVWMNFRVVGGCVNTAMTQFTVSDPPCAVGLAQYEHFVFQSCVAEIYVGNFYACYQGPTPVVEMDYIKIGNTFGWTNSCHTCIVRRISSIAQITPTNDGATFNDRARWEQASLSSSSGTGHMWDQASTQFCLSIPNGPTCAISNGWNPTVVMVTNASLTDPPNTFDYQEEDDWITQLGSPPPTWP
jgi:hypothetical protein